ncbi:MAG TPA: HAD-IIIC family phosphatase [Flavobacteriales bacterium]|nr:HAD-IIIC family phosphatase [Flavobacteriales bacterium]
MKKTFLELKKNLKKSREGMKEVKIAILADSSSQLLSQALEGYGLEAGISFRVFESDYDQIELQINDPDSELYRSESEYVVIFNSVHKLQQKFFNCPMEERNRFADACIEKIRVDLDTMFSRMKTRIIFLNFPFHNDSLFGNFSNSLDFSWTYQLRKLNFELMNLSISHTNFSIADVAQLSSHAGDKETFDPRNYIYGDIIYTLDFYALIAKSITEMILVRTGKFKKCLILDLDNTVWGGIIGDDGMENIQLGDLGNGKAFNDLQRWARELKERGIILAVCSKNTEHIAKEPFEKHPDMVLKLDDIAVFVANWENKADNIRYIQSVLNIGFDSMVFLDDNPFERGIVKTYLPEITVPELPEDPCEYMPFLRAMNLFETASYSKEDAQRTRQYQEESVRESLRRSFGSESEYLSNLDMTAEIRNFDAFSIPRVAQLSQRSNQFNLRTVRYSEDDLLQIAGSRDYCSFSVSLKDKFGDYGLIAVIVLRQTAPEELFIENWLMSCRVLKRGVENLTLNTIVEAGKKIGAKKIIGSYIPTAKNGMVKDHYEKLGFEPAGENLWELYTHSFVNRENYITINSN